MSTPSSPVLSVADTAQQVESKKNDDTKSTSQQDSFVTRPQTFMDKHESFKNALTKLETDFESLKPTTAQRSEWARVQDIAQASVGFETMLKGYKDKLVTSNEATLDYSEWSRVHCQLEKGRRTLKTLKDTKKLNEDSRMTTSKEREEDASVDATTSSLNRLETLGNTLHDALHEMEADFLVAERFIHEPKRMVTSSFGVSVPLEDLLAMRFEVEIAAL